MDILGKILIGIVAAVIFFLIALFMALPVEWAWNTLMPSTFGLKAINFWQALAFNILAGCFKTSGGGKSQA